MTLTTETWISIIVTIVSIGVNIIQFLRDRHMRKAMGALHKACGVYLFDANKDNSERTPLHARAEGVIDTLWKTLEELSK